METWTIETCKNIDLEMSVNWKYMDEDLLLGRKSWGEFEKGELWNKSNFIALEYVYFFGQQLKKSKHLR